ncbi:hypothetical protein J6590_008554 [Homalodisca vitripennis]|nr:hypothetical protein J6590_008554 [Homalodisca vitripennis]
MQQIVNPKLSIKSRKAPAPEGFITHTSKLEELKNGDFLLHWNNGHVKSVYINQNEDISIINLKKGIASLFQFQLTTQEVKETDASGECEVVYTSLDRNMVEKIKSNCHSQPELPYILHPQQLWSATVSSKRRSVIVLSPDLAAIDTIDSEEKHQLSIPLREEAGGAILSQQGIKLQEKSSGAALIEENTIDAAIKTMEKSTGQFFVKYSLSLTKESNTCADGTCPSFYSLVKENRDALKTENLGTIRSASAFVKLLKAAREAKKEDLVKTLKNTKNKKILFLLLKPRRPGDG